MRAGHVDQAVLQGSRLFRFFRARGRGHFSAGIQLQPCVAKLPESAGQYPGHHRAEEAVWSRSWEGYFRCLLCGFPASVSLSQNNQFGRLLFFLEDVSLFKFYALRLFFRFRLVRKRKFFFPRLLTGFSHLIDFSIGCCCKHIWSGGNE